jgi:hypothetical protein
MSAMTNACGTLDGFLADGAILIANANVEIGCRANLGRRWYNGDGVKKVPRDVHTGSSKRERDCHAGRSPHVLAENGERQAHISLVGGHDVGAVLTIQKAHDFVEVLFCFHDLGEDVQDIPCFIH